MSYEDIVRAWKDEEYYASLSPEQQANLPENPAGIIELTEAELEGIAGGTTPICAITIRACTTTFRTRLGCRTTRGCRKSGLGFDFESDFDTDFGTDFMDL